MDSVFNTFGGVLPMSGGFNEGTNEIPGGSEIRDINNSEGVIYDEGDIERIEICSDIMAEIFTDEVVSNWENLSIEERTGYLNEYYITSGQALGIETKGVYVEDLQALYGAGTTGVNCGDGYIGIDITRVADPSQLKDLLDTATHEMRHQLQTDAIRNPDAFPDIPRETIEKWEYEFINYIDPSYDFEGYENQAIETDARAFGDEVVNDFMSDTKRDIYSAEAIENQVPEAILADIEQTGGNIELSAVQEGIEADSFNTAEMNSRLDAFVSEDLDALFEIVNKAESTETYEGADDIGTVVKQGSSCGSGKGCMGSHYCSGY